MHGDSYGGGSPPPTPPPPTPTKSFALSCHANSSLQFCWGPLSFLVAWYIITGHPLRHSFQSLVSIGQIYGDILYYATCCFNLYHLGLNYSRPEFYYFWGYFFFVNFIWIVIPGSKFSSVPVCFPPSYSAFFRSSSFPPPFSACRNRHLRPQVLYCPNG